MRGDKGASLCTSINWGYFYIAPGQRPIAQSRSVKSVRRVCKFSHNIYLDQFLEKAVCTLCNSLSMYISEIYLKPWPAQSSSEKVQQEQTVEFCDPNLNLTDAATSTPVCTECNLFNLLRHLTPLTDTSTTVGAQPIQGEPKIGSFCPCSVPFYIFARPFPCEWKVHFELTAAALGVAVAPTQPKAYRAILYNTITIILQLIPCTTITIQLQYHTLPLQCLCNSVSIPLKYHSIKPTSKAPTATSATAPSSCSSFSSLFRYFNSICFWSFIWSCVGNQLGSLSPQLANQSQESGKKRLCWMKANQLFS